ncbi:MAG: MATE family efflux transporter, partial [Acidimicrobiia bacterium]|nr:MATE family efflux transporter [Acidimicrobiia bacterium]
DLAGAHQVTRRLLGWGLVMGVVIAGLLLASASWLGGVFTDDRAVTEAVRGVVPLAAVMQPLGALVFVADGIFMAVLAVRLLAASTGAGLAAAAGVLWFSDAAGGGLPGVWWAILAMIVARSAVFAWGARRGLGRWIRGGKR